MLCGLMAALLGVGRFHGQNGHEGVFRQAIRNAFKARF